MGWRVKVYRPHYHGPLVFQGALLGLALGLLCAVLDTFCRSYLGPSSSVSGWMDLLTLLTPLLLLLFIQRKCDHLKWCFFIGGVTAGCACLGAQLLLRNLDRYEALLGSQLLGALVDSMGSGLFGGLLYVLLAKARMRIFGRVLTQNGTMCPRCAYPIVHLPEQRCPECGSGFTTNDLDPSVRTAQPRWKRLAAGAAIGFVLFETVYLVYPYVVMPARSAGLINDDCAARWLALRPRCAEEILVDYLESGPDEPRRFAAFHLGFMPLSSDRFVPALARSARDDPDPLVRQLAIQSLGHSDVSALVQNLPYLLRDEDHRVRWMALTALALGGDVVGSEGTRYLIKALDDSHVQVRSWVYQRLTENTGVSLPYDPTAPREQRLADRAQWQKWWNARNSEPAVAQPDPRTGG